MGNRIYQPDSWPCIGGPALEVGQEVPGGAGFKEGLTLGVGASAEAKCLTPVSGPMAALLPRRE